MLLPSPLPPLYSPGSLSQNATTHSGQDFPRSMNVIKIIPTSFWTCCRPQFCIPTWYPTLAGTQVGQLFFLLSLSPSPKSTPLILMLSVSSVTPLRSSSLLWYSLPTPTRIPVHRNIQNMYSHRGCN